MQFPEKKIVNKKTLLNIDVISRKKIANQKNALFFKINIDGKSRSSMARVESPVLG